MSQLAEKFTVLASGSGISGGSGTISVSPSIFGNFPSSQFCLACSMRSRLDGYKVPVNVSPFGKWLTAKHINRAVGVDRKFAKPAVFSHQNASGFVANAFTFDAPF
jgi:hypothetical protein